MDGRILSHIFKTPEGEMICLTRVEHSQGSQEKLFWGYEGKQLTSVAITDSKNIEQGGFIIQTQLGTLVCFGRALEHSGDQAFNPQRSTWIRQSVTRLDPESYDCEFIGASGLVVRLKDSATQG